MGLGCVLIRSTILFTGSVQGVGFRATACSVARRFDVEGGVQNQRDGSVKCIVEGDKGDVDHFIAALQGSMQGFITDTRIEESAATGEFRGQGFEVWR